MVNEENKKIYKRKIWLLEYYNRKQNKTDNDLKKIKELKEDIEIIKAENKDRKRKIRCQVELDRLKNSWENEYITMFDIEDMLFYLEMQRKTEIMIICTDIFLAINKRYYFDIKIVLRQTS